jgi:hypothetical protein
MTELLRCETGDVRLHQSPGPENQECIFGSKSGLGRNFVDLVRFIHRVDLRLLLTSLHSSVVSTFPFLGPHSPGERTLPPAHVASF